MPTRDDVTPGGATAGMYAWGDVIQGYHNISYEKRLPSVTLTDVGYYTDDGAYYYVWGTLNAVKMKHLYTPL